MKYLPYVLMTAALAAAVTVLLFGQACDPGVESQPPLPLPQRLRPIACDRLTWDFIEGRRSLLEVAVLFDKLNNMGGPGRRHDRWSEWTHLSLRLPGRTKAERLCQQVEAWVRAALADDPMHCETVLERLEAEFNDAVRQDGDITLPDPEKLETDEQIINRTEKELTPKERQDIYRTKPHGR